jgi:hypothetical protein
VDVGVFGGVADRIRHMNVGVKVGVSVGVRVTVGVNVRVGVAGIRTAV